MINMNGLTDRQVSDNRRMYGSNKLPEPPMKTWVDFAVDALKDPTLMILIVIAVLQLVLAVAGVMSFSEPIAVLVVLALATTLSVKTGLDSQKSKADLKAETSTRYCEVIRNGRIQTINTDDIVVDDIVLVGTGQQIFADGYIIDGKITVNNSAINGETKEIEKTPIKNFNFHAKVDSSTDAYTDQNSLFAGTQVMSGEGKMIVTQVGINTVNGDTLVKSQTLEAPETALDIALGNLAAFITKWGSLAATLTFIVLVVTGIVSLGFDKYFDGGVLEILKKFAQNLSVAVSIVVAAVPEGLPLIIELVTKQNVSTMKKFNILAKNPNKIPELAYVDLICTDKTGTLTTGVMTPERIIDGAGNDITKNCSTFEPLVNNICLNNSAVFDDHGNITGGNSIDRATLSLIPYDRYCTVSGIDGLGQKNKQVFSSSNKYSAYECKKGLTYYKGAPEKLIANCKYYYDGNEVKEMTKEVVNNMNKAISNMTSQAMRCIALTENIGTITENQLPNNMTLIGIIGVVDPVRKEVPNAVKIAHDAGIQIIEITGDCIETAKAVAIKSGIYEENGADIALTDSEFVQLSDEKVKEILPNLRVIARCSPQTKLRLVTLAQEVGRSVAMTGDGVNDSAALKKSDVGFGMQSGSDVAKEASDIILTDDNFASIVKGVELGRTFMHNIMMFLEFQLPINIALLILSTIYPLVATGAFLASVQILIVNIIMDSLNSLSFGGEPPKVEYMTEKPIKKGSGLFICGAKQRIAVTTVGFIALYGILILSPIAKMFGTDELGMTARFALLCFMAVFNGFNTRTDSLNLFNGISKNKLFVEIAISICVFTVLLCNVASSLVNTTALDITHWITIIILALMIVPVDFLRKVIVNKQK